LIVINGWTVLAHSLFLDQTERLAAAVEKAKAKDPEAHGSTASAKTLGAIIKLVSESIPSDPTSKNYRQGNTLGSARRHWFRAKFGNGRFRLFFRFDTPSKTVIYAWVNDEGTKRTYGSSTDAYKVFGDMLDAGNPPDDWNALYAACTGKQATARFGAVMKAAAESRE
jgi:toxin YhaV